MRRLLECTVFAIVAMAPPHAMCSAEHPSTPREIRVGPHETITRVKDAARVARDGDVVLIEPGDYTGDVASWPQSNLTLRAPRCCARLLAGGRNAEGKAIWVIKGDNVVVDNIEFSGARVFSRNGAGIRQEGPGRLLVRNSRFTGNELGILSSANAQAQLIVEQCEFDHNRLDTDQEENPGHQIYVGRIARFTLRDSYVHHGYIGHLVKSRARANFIYYNRLSDEAGGRASYELEFPDGGIAYVVGNIIQQGPETENATMIAFAAERFYWKRNELYLVNNTLIDDARRFLPLVHVRAGTDVVRATNNIVVADGWAGLRLAGVLNSTTRATPADMPLAGTADYRLSPSSPLVGTAIDPGLAHGVALRPDREYVHPRSSRAVADAPYSPGALQSLAP